MQQENKLTWVFQILQADGTEEGIDTHIEWTKDQLSTNILDSELQRRSIYTALELRQCQTYLPHQTDKQQPTLSVK